MDHFYFLEQVMINVDRSDIAILYPSDQDKH
jgi:hypothetical protein